MVPLAVHSGSSTDPVTQPGEVTVPVAVHSGNFGRPVTPTHPSAVHCESVTVPLIPLSLISPSAVQASKAAEPDKKIGSIDGETDGLIDGDKDADGD